MLGEELRGTLTVGINEPSTVRVLLPFPARVSAHLHHRANLLARAPRALDMTQNGDTALHLFARSDNANVVRLLMLAGADATVMNDEGKLAEEYAQPAVAAIIQAGSAQPEVGVTARDDGRRDPPTATLTRCSVAAVGRGMGMNITAASRSDWGRGRGHGLARPPGIQQRRRRVNASALARRCPTPQAHSRRSGSSSSRCRRSRPV